MLIIQFTLVQFVDLPVTTILRGTTCTLDLDEVLYILIKRLLLHVYTTKCIWNEAVIITKQSL